MYFALEGLVDRFVYLHYGLAAILVFLGTKFAAQGFGLQVPILVSLLVTAVVVTVAIVVSLMATRGRWSGGGGNARGASWRGLVDRIVAMVLMPLEFEGGKE